MPWSTCDLVDERPELVTCQTPLRLFGGHRSFTGKIHTISCLRDNVFVHTVLEEPGDGRVLVVDGHANATHALLGDRVALVAQRSGWAGVIINGAIRDAEAMANVEIGVAALWVTPRRGEKNGIGAIGVPVSFGDATFEPGATVWCDADGVLTEPHKA